MMEHGLGPTFRGLFSIMKNNQLKLGGKEGRLAGEALDNIMNSANLRLVDDVNNNPFRSDILDKAKEPFYLLNGLGPITRIFKDFDAMMRSHSLIDYSVRWTQGKATKQEQEYLLRYNIDLEDARSLQMHLGRSLSLVCIWRTRKHGLIQLSSLQLKLKSYLGQQVSLLKGRYKAAFYRDSEKKIYIDEEYIKDVMYEQRGWENPRVEGVKPIKKGIINTPEDYVTFIKMHEIMHSLNRPKDMGFDMRRKESKAAYENMQLMIWLLLK